MSERFPPKSAGDITQYGDEEVFAGYLDWREGDPEPGPNRSPGYRWGWQNAKRDRSRDDDGFDGIRAAYLQGQRTNK